MALNKPEALQNFANPAVVAGVPDQAIRLSTGTPFRLRSSAVRNHRIAVRLPSESCPPCVGFRIGYAAAELKPLYLRLRELILGSLKIAVDETVAPVLDPGRGRTKKGYFWAIARDDRPWGGTDPPAIAYTYAPGRGAVHALKLLDTYHGIVQCDGYAAYKNIANAAYLGEAITLAFCWAHLRRKFFEIAKGGSAPIASEALDRIALLYAIEKTIRGRSADERRAVRQEKSKPLVLALKIWLEEQLARVSAKSVIAEAIRYGPPAIAYTYAPGRGAVHALKLLDTYHGIVQCDGYAAYKNIANAAYLGEAITLAFCWAHLRRKFVRGAKLVAV